MYDEVIMNTALTLSKNMCDILMHGAIESAEVKINKTFLDGFNAFIGIQQNIFKEMEEKGFYNLEKVQTSKIEKVKAKHEAKEMG